MFKDLTIDKTTVMFGFLLFILSYQLYDTINNRDINVVHDGSTEGTIVKKQVRNDKFSLFKKEETTYLIYYAFKPTPTSVNFLNGHCLTTKKKFDNANYGDKVTVEYSVETPSITQVKNICILNSKSKLDKKNIILLPLLIILLLTGFLVTLFRKKLKSIYWNFMGDDSLKKYEAVAKKSKTTTNLILKIKHVASWSKWFLLLIFCVFALILYWKDTKTVWLLSEQSVVTKATITNIDTSRYSGFLAKYSFTDKRTNKRYQGKGRLNIQIKDPTLNKHIYITYYPANPNYSRIGSYSNLSKAKALGFMFVINIFGLVPLPFAIWGLIRNRKKKKITSEPKTTAKSKNLAFCLWLGILAITVGLIGYLSWNYFSPLIKNLKIASPEFTHINSVESLNEFITKGKKQGYFPSQIFSTGMNQEPIKLQPVDIQFRPVLNWVEGATCTQHIDQIILATSDENQAVECGFDDTVTILGSGDDWLDDAWGNDIVVPGAGDDNIDAGYGNDIIIFEKNWGHDTVKIKSKKINKKDLPGYKGGYPWEFTSFIIFGEGISRDEIIWKGNQLVNTTTGDTITLNTKDINILFASSPSSIKEDQSYVPQVQVSEKTQLEELNAESILVQGNTAYYAKGNDGLYIVDITSLNSPTILSKLMLPGRAMSVQINDDIAYISQVDGGLLGKRGWVSLVNVKDPQSPKLLITIPFGAGVYNVAVTDDYLYVPDSNKQKKQSKLYIYDIRQPNKPKLLSTTVLEKFAQYVAYLDETLYMSSKYRGIQVFDVSNPEKPKMTAKYGFGKAWVRSIKIQDNKIIVNQDKNNFVVLGPAPGKKLYTLCKVKIPNTDGDNSSIGVDSIWLRDGFVFRAEGKRGISITDIRDTKNCKVVGNLPIDNQWVSSVSILKNTLVAFNDQKKSSLYNLDLMYPDYKVEEPVSGKIEDTKNDIVGNEKDSSNLSDDQLYKLLYDAAADDDAEQVKSLCQQGAKPNRKGHSRHKPVEISAMLGNLESLKALLECSAVPTGKAMIRAALNDEFDAMKMLQSYGGDIAQTDEDGCTTLHYIAQDGTVEMVKYLVESGVPIDATCRGKETALKWAHFDNNIAVIEYLTGSTSENGDRSNIP